MPNQHQSRLRDCGLPGHGQARRCVGAESVLESKRDCTSARATHGTRGRYYVATALLVLTATLATGCQTVKIPEEAIAARQLPREFDMAAMPPYTVAPPDLILVEALEALPGRPITGEHLVRPDGTISLGFYGNVFVAGLTLDEIKEKVVLHLRKYLSDESLGLYAYDDEKKKYVVRDPAESPSVFVDVASYNSKFYYVQGDVAAPGRVPITGNETVLDAIQNAGGLMPTAAPTNIRLVRPAPVGACCEQKLPVNLAAIVSGGDPTTNYQLMPGDRLVVYRDPIVRATIFLDRLAAPFQTVINSTMQTSFLLRNLQYLKAGVASPTSTTSSTAVVQPGAR